MLDRFESQALRATIADLAARVAPTVKEPGAAAALAMATRLLANVVARGETPAFDGIESEVAALQGEEAREDALLAAGAGARAAGALSPASLTPYVASRIPGASVAAIEATLGGFSKKTLLLRLAGAPQLDDALVIRCDEAGGPVESTAATELAILRLMRRHGVPVAEPLWADHAFPFGGTALVTRRLAGGSAYDATGATLGPEGPNAARGLARILAQIHAVPVSEVELPEGLRGASLGTHVERMVAGYRAQWRRHRLRPSPVIDAALEYLATHVPADTGPLAVVHGDASLRNLLLADGRATGLVDWELWHVGDPNEDLAYCRQDVEPAIGWDAFLAEYRAAGGRPFHAGAAAYYGLFGAVRNVIFGASIIHGFVRSETRAMRFAFAASYLARKLVPDVARRLKELRA